MPPPAPSHAVMRNSAVAMFPRALPGEEVPPHPRIPKGITATIKSARIRPDVSQDTSVVMNVPGCAQDGQTLPFRFLNMYACRTMTRCYRGRLGTV